MEGKYHFIVSKNEQYGIVNSEGKTMIPLKYSFINKSKDSDGFIIARINESKDNQTISKWGAITIHDRVIIPFIYSSLMRAYNNDNMFIGKQEDEKGVEYHTIFNQNGIKQFSAISDKVKYFNEDYAKMFDESGEYLIDSTGLKLSNKYDRIHSPVNGMIRCDINNLTGFMDMNCNELIKPQFYFFGTSDFGQNGIARVRKQNEWEEAYIDRMGNNVFDIGPSYRYFGGYSNGICAAYTVSEDGDSEYNHCIFDFNSGEIIKCFGPMQANAKFEPINENIVFWGIPIGEQKYKLWVIDRLGNEIYNSSFDDFVSGNEELIITIVIEDNHEKYGLLAKSGEYSVPNIYDGIEILRINKSADIIVAKKGKYYGIVDDKGKTLHEFNIDKITRIENDMLLIEKNGNAFLYSKDLQYLFDTENLIIKYTCPNQSNCYIVQDSNKKQGVFDFSKRDWILEPIYDRIQPLEKLNTSR